VGIVAPLGDLVESILKRSCNIKDSGNFFPGHGGVLDRCDSLLFAVPVAYYYIKWFLL
jgi:phosphatidate cytidylyltransferase